jgi:hypothetical protein
MRSIVVMAVAVGACGSVPEESGDGGPSGDGAGTADAPPGTCADDPCGENADCSDSPSGAICECRPGFVGDGQDCASAWALRHTIPVSLGDFHHAVGAGNRIYYSRDTTDPIGALFESVEPESGMVRSENAMAAGDNDLCGCGYGGWLVPIGDRIYYFGNSGHSYDMGLRLWSTEPYPAQFQRGESGQAALGSVLYTVGGRGGSTATFAFAPTGGWGDVNAPYPAATEGAVAIGTPDSLMYAQDRQSATFARFDPVAGAWEQLDDSPSSNPVDGVEHEGKIVMHYGGRIYVYDTDDESWDNRSVPLPTGTSSHLVKATGQIWLLAVQDAAVEIYHLDPAGLP